MKRMSMLLLGAVVATSIGENCVAGDRPLVPMERFEVLPGRIGTSALIPLHSSLPTQSARLTQPVLPYQPLFAPIRNQQRLEMSLEVLSRNQLIALNNGSGTYLELFNATMVLRPSLSPEELNKYLGGTAAEIEIVACLKPGSKVNNSQKWLLEPTSGNYYSTDITDKLKYK